MQLYILDKDPITSAKLLLAKLKGKNYAQKMLIELGQCLSNLMGNKDYNKLLYNYKAVPPQFTSFIFANKEWILEYYYALGICCLNNYNNFLQTDTWNNFTSIWGLFSGFCGDEVKELEYAWFVPQKEYGERQYLSIDDCIVEYKKYLAWKNEGV